MVYYGKNLFQSYNMLDFYTPEFVIYEINANYIMLNEIMCVIQNFENLKHYLKT